MKTVRRAAVAGMFYPNNPAELEQTLTDLLAHPEGARRTQPPKALIVPHAGYVYSGPIAASAYAQLEPLRGRVRRVVLLGPAHYAFVRGLALPDAQCFRTPLGEVPLDLNRMRQLDAMPQVVRSADAHHKEHSLEVQLPFLQHVLGDFELLPLAVGEASAEEVADVLDAVWGGDETLIVISSDLSHFLPDTLARRMDQQTVAEIVALDSHIDAERACGATPINGMLLAAKRHGLRAVTLDVRNSSQTAGDPDRVVGYAAFAFEASGSEATSDGSREAFHESYGAFDESRGEILLKLARAAISARLGQKAQPVSEPEWLAEPGATFVTLTIKGELRGCIGTLDPYRSLTDDVKENAVAAAFRDPRFDPLRPAELNDVRVEVSLLSPVELIVAADEPAALAALRPHVDGVVLEYKQYRGLFLPQVWEQLPEPARFLAHLKRKASLPMNFWSPAVRLLRFTVSKWKEVGA
ncbi:MAG: TIGR00296 family protein [Gemmatimonas sp.]|nr:TIGR00296 family protein [Gemmatimonas sp.]